MRIKGLLKENADIYVAILYMLNLDKLRKKKFTT